MHLKRQQVPKSWDIPRKGTKYVIRPGSNMEKGIPLLILLRDLLKVVQNRKELKKAIKLDALLLNGNPVMDEKQSVVIFDKISLKPMKKNYELAISEKGKFYLREIKESEANQKISKIINKKILKKKKVQINLSDGYNFISDVKCKVNDSVIIDFKQKKLLKCIPLAEKAKAIVFEGKHVGKEGIIKKIDLEKKNVEMEVKGKQINVLIKQLMVKE